MGEDIHAGESGFGQMVSYPPLVPSSAWFSCYIKALREGMVEREAMEIANQSLPTVKEFGRYAVKNNKGRITLSVALEGGGKQLRKIDSGIPILLSEHGDWRKVHMGGLEASLGRTPYYRHIEPELKSIYQNLEIINLKDFNAAIFQCLKAFLLGNISTMMLQELSKQGLWQERGKEIAENIIPDLSVVQSLSEYGRETLLGIMMMDY